MLNSGAPAHSPKSEWLLPGIVLLSLAIFLLDYLTPVGYSVWPLYLIPLMLTVRTQERRFLPIVAAFCTVLVVLGFFLVWPDIYQQAAIFRRAVGVSMLWFTVVLLRQRMQVEEALRGAAYLLSEAQRVAHIGSWRYDVTGRITWSDDAYRIYGRSPDTFTPKADLLLNLIHPDDRAAMQGWIAACLAAEKPRELEFRAILPDGAIRAMRGQGELKYDKDGRPAYIAGTVEDISERRHADEALRSFEEQFRHGRMVTFDWDIAHSRITWSRGHEALFGLPPGEFPGTWEAFAQRVHAEDLPGVNAEVARCIAARESFTCEFRVVWPDGAVHWVAGQGEFTFSDAGQAMGMQGVMLDITERKRTEEALRQSEEQFSTAFRAAPIAFGISSLKDGRIVEVNDAYLRLLGYSREELIGHTAADLDLYANPSDRTRMLDLLQPDRSLSDFDTMLRTRSGELRYVRVSSAVIAMEGRPHLLGTLVDVTEHKRAEEKLLKSEAQGRAVLASLNEGVVFLDTTGAIVSINDAVTKVLGRSLQELTDPGLDPRSRLIRSDGSLFPLEEQPAIVALRTGEPVRNVEMGVPSHDGGLKWIIAGAQLARNTAGSTLGVVVSFFDITERKGAEAALRESEARLNEAQHSARIGSWCYLSDGSLTMSDEMYDLYKLPRDVPATYEMVIAAVHPDDRARNNSRFQKALESGALDFQDDYRLVWPDGEVRNIFGLGKIRRDADGQVIEAVGTVQDVTERKQAEETILQLNADLEQRVRDRTAQLEDANIELRDRRAELESLFESLPGLYLVLTPELEIVAASDAYLKATLTTRDGIIGRDLFEIFPDNPDDTETTAVSNMRASIERVFQNAAPDTMAIQKHDIRGPDGVFVERYWSPINSPMFGADRQIKYIVHRVEEVTEFMRQRSRPSSDTTEFRIRMEQMEAEVFQSSQKMQAANQQLEAANKELEAFSYSVSHDLRSPLRAINGFARMLTEDHGHKLDAEGRRVLGVVSSEALRMGQLIDELLQFSRLGRQPLQKSSTDMTALARRVYEELCAGAPNRTIDFRLDSLPSVPADPVLLRQVWINLLDNALKFTRYRERAEIVVSGSVQSGEAVYSVADNGAGFDRRYAGKLFGVFQRLHGPDEFEGTGVGLALVQRIVHRHGGRIWADATLDRGATFSFSLPLPETAAPGASAGKPDGTVRTATVSKGADR